MIVMISNCRRSDRAAGSRIQMPISCKVSTGPGIVFPVRVIALLRRVKSVRNIENAHIKKTIPVKIIEIIDIGKIPNLQRL